MSFRAHRRSGYGYASPTELTEVPIRVIPGEIPRVLCHSLTELTEVPGTGTEDSRNSRKFRVWYGSLTKLTKVLGRYTNVVPVPQVLWHGRAELTEVSGTGMNVVQNSQKFWVRM